MTQEAGTHHHLLVIDSLSKKWYGHAHLDGLSSPLDNTFAGQVNHLRNFRSQN